MEIIERSWIYRAPADRVDSFRGRGEGGGRRFIAYF